MVWELVIWSGERSLHVIKIRNLALLVANDREVDLAARHVLDVLDPALVAVDRVGGQANQLDAALGKLGLEAGHLAELGRTHGGVVLRVREEDDPVVADKLVEVDRALGRLGLEVGRRVAQAEAKKMPVR